MISLGKAALVWASEDMDIIKSALSVPVLRLDSGKTGASIGEILAGRFRKGAELVENLIIFHGLTNAELDDALEALRSAGVSSLKAVTTPTNLAWTVEALYKELCRERNSFKKRR